MWICCNYIRYSVDLSTRFWYNKLNICRNGFLSLLCAPQRRVCAMPVFPQGGAHVPFSARPGPPETGRLHRPVPRPCRQGRGPDFFHRENGRERAFCRPGRRLAGAMLPAQTECGRPSAAPQAAPGRGAVLSCGADEAAQGSVPMPCRPAGESIFRCGKGESFI